MSPTSPTETVARVEAGDHFRLLRWLDYWFVLRPTLMFPLFTMLLAGHRLVDPVQPTPPWRWVWLAAAFTALFGLGFVLNQIVDRPGDRLNGKLLLVSGGLISDPALKALCLILAVLAPLALLISGFGGLAPWIMAMFLLGGVFYNFKPLVLQSSPWGGIAASALGGYLLMETGARLGGGSLPWVRMLPYLASFTAAGLLTGLPDLEGDRRAGKRTFAVKFGRRATLAVAFGGVLASAALGAVQSDLVITLPAVLASAAVLLALVKSHPGTAVAGNKMAILTLSVLVGWSYPIYLAAMALHYLSSRWYHRRRFGLDYPNLRGD